VQSIAHRVTYLYTSLVGEVVRLEAVRRDTGIPPRLQVHAALRQAIVRGDLRPGQRLSENALAADLGVSRTPVREALARLRDDRLVEIVPQLGTFVSRISPEAVADAQFIREALECAAVRRAAQLASEDDIARLGENLDGQERAGAANDYDAFYLLDDDFHRRLCDLSGRLAVWAVSERAKSHLNRVRRLSLGMPDYLPEMIDEHRSVVSAIADRDPDLAESELRHHLRMVLREVPKLRQEHPDFFQEA
jgi:GntR family transcriptional regulator, rspAB operon transcriptional repressor